jgi:hypothetical protein
MVVAETRCERAADPGERTPWRPHWPLRIAFNTLAR